MSATAPQDKLARQPLIASWVAQMIGTLVLAAVVLAYVRSAGAPFAISGESEWRKYAMVGILGSIAPALLYLRTFKRRLNADEAAALARGFPDPGLRALLRKGLAIGGALCEIPMAMGVVQLFLGGDTRWFFGATLITIALRLSYRPFNKD
ncbi:MAG: hypothetical protein ABIR98_12210 [Usitatibacter sp.]